MICQGRKRDVCLKTGVRSQVMTVCDRCSSYTHSPSPVQNLAARRWVACLIVATGLLLGARSGAQGPPRFASPALPPDHWAVVAARRAIVLGLAPRAAGWGEGTLTEALAGLALHEASKRSNSLDPKFHL